MAQLSAIDPYKRELEGKLAQAEQTISELRRTQGATPASPVSGGVDPQRLQEAQMRLSQLQGELQAKDSALNRLKMQLEQANRLAASAGAGAGAGPGADTAGLQQENLQLKGQLEKLQAELQAEKTKVEAPAGPSPLPPRPIGGAFKPAALLS